MSVINKINDITEQINNTPEGFITQKDVNAMEAINAR
jgi:hypothetical protein